MKTWGSAKTTLPPALLQQSVVTSRLHLGSCFDSVSTCRSECWKGREERGGRVDMTRFVSRYKWKVFRFDSLGRIGERLEGLRIRKIFFIGEGKCFVIRILVNHYRVKLVFVC